MLKKNDSVPWHSNCGVGHGDAIFQTASDPHDPAMSQKV